MLRASPVEMRRTLELVDLLKASYVRFVPVPVNSEEEYQVLLSTMVHKIDEEIDNNKETEEDEVL